VKLGIAKLPNKVNWKHIFGLGLLAGIGFTMSVFIALLSFNSIEYQIQAKFAIIVSSVLAGISGYAFLSSLNHKKTTISAKEA
jgi:NhaA family Na+:H+ antiporter